VTGTAWLDGTFAATFALLAVLAIGRTLPRRRTAAERADAAAHAVMAAGMSAMAVGAGDPVPAGAWIATFVALGTASTAVLLRSAWWRPGPPVRGPGPPAAGSQRRAVPAGTAHHLAASVLMVVALAGGHGAHRGHGEHAGHGERPAEAAAPHAHHMHAAHGHTEGTDPDPVGGSVASGDLATAVPSPVLAGAGAGFLGYAGWLALGFARSRRPGACTCAGRPGRLDALCTVAMSAGMGVMALTMV
jgi:hypothetical protein